MLVIRIATKNEYINFETIQPEATPILNFVQQNTFVDKPNENRMKQYAVLFPWLDFKWNCSKVIMTLNFCWANCAPLQNF